MNLKVHYLFLVWLLLSATVGEFDSALILVVSVCLHELGHIFAAQNLGVEVTEVELMPFGGIAKLNRLLGSDPATEAAIALAGPANSLVLLVVGLLYSSHPWARDLMECNALLLVVNLLPVLPLDGGRILKSFIVKREGLGHGLRQLLAQTRRIAWLAVAVACVAVYLGIFSLNAIVLALFILYASAEERKMMPYITMNYVGTRVRELHLRGIMQAKQLVVQRDTTAQEVLNYLTPGYYHLFTVVQGDKTTVVTEDMLWERVMSRGLSITFADVLDL